MKIEEIKEKMTAYTDFFGGNLLETDLIKLAKNRQTLKSIIDRHRDHLEGQANDAQHSLDRFQDSIGLGFKDTIECPECFEEKDQEELDMFGGLCEGCMND